ncbi:sigma-70 family RNA polymerase sigma factor [Jiangella aurantiaca]|uniref:Sigma-70 family RNA polymerase sigma factor n=1 Tax=Jiangella aurantiaca TaxID=2530373 RepID=A0A4R5AAC0_9ACTN|nr:sigma-70 family RNA polymerase sigma factor [Jiangella aurantiaca]TDD69081.1 sigma-70 family RNA polymerase sigma factor [Jiangella aurantiaca]
MTIPADGASDEQLIARTREGDMGAYDELYRRHVDDASKVARIVTNNSDEAQDVVAEAFTRVLMRLREGGGPDLDFAPYLKTVVRRLAIDRHRSSQRDGSQTDPSILDILPTADDAMARSTDRQLVRHAFETLPERWQQVLWHTEIEGRSPASLAPALGSSANAVAALAYRAREGLRQAYLAVNLSAEVQPECRPYAPKIASYVRGTLSAHDTREMSAHLATCAHCRERRDELLLLVSDMRGILWPALLLPASGVAAGAVAAAGAGATGGGVLAFLSPASWGKQARQFAAAGGVAAAAAAIAVAAWALTSNDDPADPPAAAPSASAESDPPADDPPDDEPADPPQAPPEQEEQPPAEPPADEPPADQPIADPPEEEPDEPAEEEPPVDQPEVEPSQPSETPTSEPTEEPTEEPTPEPTPEPTQPPAEAPPTIDRQPPPNPVVVAGEDVTLTVAVSGNPPPELQWQYADPPTGSSGGQPAGEQPQTATAETSGPSFLIVPTSSGTPYVQSADDRADEVPADETPDGSQDVPPEEDWVDVAGATTDTLVIEAPDRDIDGRLYRVKATNPLGTITTEPAVITVQYPPAIEEQPQSVTVVEGGTAVFEATAVANPDAMTITWQARPPGGEWRSPDTTLATSRQEGVTSTLKLTGVGSERDGYQYRAVFTNEVGEATSEPATLTVHWQPEITEQPESVEAGPGDDVEFTASASANPEATWAWESAPSADGPWTPVPDATGTGPDATLTRTGVTLDDDHTRYRAVFTNELGSVTTDAATLEVVRAGRFEVDLGEHGTRCIVVDGADVPRAGDCADAPSRGWEVPGDGTIVWRETGECLDGVAPIEAVVLAPCDDGDSQQWNLDPETSAAQPIKSVKYHAFVLDIEQVAPDGRVILFPSHNGINQQFRYIQP